MTFIALLPFSYWCKWGQDLLRQSESSVATVSFLFMYYCTQKVVISQVSVEVPLIATVAHLGLDTCTRVLVS